MSTSTSWVVNRPNVWGVKTLYGWIPGSGPVHAVTVACAQWLVFVVPLVLIVAWWWPGVKRVEIRRLIVAAGISAVLSGCALLLLAGHVQSPRPFVSLHLTPLFPHAPDASFPSDHTLLGMALAAPFVWRRWRLGLPLALITIIVGLARVASAVHWPSDIAGSIIIGLVLGLPALPLATRIIGWLPRQLRQWLQLDVRPAEA